MNNPAADCELKLLFPGGRRKALTLSYDDGTKHDRTLVSILNRYGIRATFHLNSAKLDHEGYLSAAEVRSLYSGHEIASHTMNHPNLCEFDESMIRHEVGQDMNALSRIAGYPVTGFSYPFGAYNGYVADVLRSLGIAYARTVQATNAFDLPTDFLMWHPTCHHGDDIHALSSEFRRIDVQTDDLRLMHVWGHSYEFQHDWEYLRKLCSGMSGDPGIWYATIIEIRDYLAAAAGREYSPEAGTVKNPSSGTIWLSCKGRTLALKPGETYSLRR